MERILDLLRGLRDFMEVFSNMKVLGIHVDWFFHLTGAAVVVFLATRFVPRRRAVQIAVALILAKEIFDVFAKTRLEYIRPPEADISLDVASGLTGTFLGWWAARRFPGRRDRPEPAAAGSEEPA